MSRSRAKIIMAAGVFSCLISLLLCSFNLVWETDYPQLVLPMFFVGGIILIIFSPPYYTEK